MRDELDELKGVKRQKIEGTEKKENIADVGVDIKDEQRTSTC